MAIARTALSLLTPLITICNIAFIQGWKPWPSPSPGFKTCPRPGPDFNTETDTDPCGILQIPIQLERCFLILFLGVVASYTYRLHASESAEKVSDVFSVKSNPFILLEYPYLIAYPTIVLATVLRRASTLLYAEDWGPHTATISIALNYLIVIAIGFIFGAAPLTGHIKLNNEKVAGHPNKILRTIQWYTTLASYPAGIMNLFVGHFLALSYIAICTVFVRMPSPVAQLYVWGHAKAQVGDDIVNYVVPYSPYIHLARVLCTYSFVPFSYVTYWLCYNGSYLFGEHIPDWIRALVYWNPDGSPKNKNILIRTVANITIRASAILSLFLIFFEFIPEKSQHVFEMAGRIRFLHLFSFLLNSWQVKAGLLSVFQNIRNTQLGGMEGWVVTVGSYYPWLRWGYHRYGIDFVIHFFT